MFRPRIIHKGIAFVLIPLVVNTIFIAVLTSSLSRAKVLVTQEHNQTAILTHMDKLAVLVVNIWGSLTTYATTGNEMARRHNAKLNVKARKEIAYVASLTNNDPPVLEYLNELSASIDADEKLIPALTGSIDSDFQNASVVSKANTFRRMIFQSGQKNEILMKIMAEQEAHLERLKQEEEQAENQVQIAVIAGLIANFAIAFLLIFLFCNDVTKRLKVLVHNANMLPKNVPLSQKVTGSDELTDLDAVIHQASAQLIESAEYRRGLMQMMAHDLRSPLTASMTALQLLTEMQKEIMERGKRQVDSINLSLQTCVDLINDLLLLESLEVGQLVLNKEPANLKDVIGKAVSMVSSLATMKKIEISDESLDEDVEVDCNRILQVVTNLLSNAIKFAPPGSTIRVTTKVTDHNIIVAVIDKGRGVTPADRAKLFQKFQQTDEGRSAGGTGLGLAISKLIVESHGGKIGVESSPGNGSKFYFALPVEV